MICLWDFCCHTVLSRRTATLYSSKSRGKRNCESWWLPMWSDLACKRAQSFSFTRVCESWTILIEEEEMFSLEKSVIKLRGCSYSVVHSSRRPMFLLMQAPGSKGSRLLMTWVFLRYPIQLLLYGRINLTHRTTAELILTSIKLVIVLQLDMDDEAQLEVMMAQVYFPLHRVSLGGLCSLQN